jgi:hypothetical protein
MQKKCVKPGCGEDASIGSNYCDAHKLQGGMVVYHHDPKPPKNPTGRGDSQD